MRVLMVVSAAQSIELADGSAMEIGYWASEVRVPYEALRKQGYEVVIATPGGAVPSPDPHSLPADAAAETKRLAEIVAKPSKLEDVWHDESFAAVVIPGGYAPMVDLAESNDMGRLLERAMAKGTIVAAICHGPAAFLSVRRKDQVWPFAGYRMAAFTDGEESAWLKERRLRWTVESALRKQGAKVEPGANWASVVIRDRNLITGQSSPSVRAWTDALLEALEKR